MPDREVLGSTSQHTHDGIDRTGDRVPVWCPICDLVMKGDSKTYYDWGCCQLCFIQFVDEREVRWIDGWRPSAEEVEAFISTMGGFHTKT